MLSIDHDSATPPFEQLRTQLMDRISSNELAAGHKLPTVRSLAQDLSIAPGTVAKAYRALEASGLIETRGRNGTFVSATGDPLRQEAQRAAASFAEQIRALHFDPDEALALVTAALRGSDPTPA